MQRVWFTAKGRSHQRRSSDDEDIPSSAETLPADRTLRCSSGVQNPSVWRLSLHSGKILAPVLNGNPVLTGIPTRRSLNLFENKSGPQHKRRFLFLLDITSACFLLPL